MKILIIGGGNMGITYARSFINSHVVNAEQLMILEKDKNDRIENLVRLGLAQIITDYARVPEAELVILAVKPQDAASLFSQIKPFVDPSQVFLSIMAGITIQTIRKGLEVNKIIRAMPNLPAQIGSGMTAFTATEEVSRFEEQWIQNLLQTTGKTLNVRTETQIDVVTAISGSGPAYIYYFMESMIKAAMEMGIATAEAELLVKQTFFGALQLYQQGNFSCSEWIQKVASKGGTTEAAIQTFQQNKLDQIIIEGATAAFKRAVELGK
jgi:pyrroline-5-carboxylate reductase